MSKFHHLLVDWDGNTAGEECSASVRSELAKDFEKRIKATPKRFKWLLSPEGEKPIAIRWTGWADVLTKLKTYRELVSGIIEIARDNVTEVSQPLWRIGDDFDHSHIQNLEWVLPRYLGKEGNNVPWSVHRAMLKAIEIREMPVLLTVVNTPLARRWSLDEYERQMAAAYFGVFSKRA